MPGYAEQSPTYQPSMRLVTAITNAYPATITTSFNHGYLAGLIVRIMVPDLYGMYQINQLDGEIITVPSPTSFTIDLDTRSFDVFTVPSPEPWYQFSFAMSVPVGEINSTLDQATRNVL